MRARAEAAEAETLRSRAELAQWKALADAHRQDSEDVDRYIERAEKAEAELARLQQVRDFVARERALRDAHGKGGQHVGHSPSISPSVLKELERLVGLIPVSPTQQETP
jgi:hypothetical protein